MCFMPRCRPSSSTLAALLTASAIALAAGAPAAAASAPEPSQAIAGAAALVEDGQLVRARGQLRSLRETSLTPAQRQRVDQLLSVAERRLRFTDVVEISLQKADLALETGDLRGAERQAEAAAAAQTATAAQRALAAEYLDQARDRRAEIAPAIPAALAQAVSDFAQENYAAAKAGFEAVYRSGVELTPEQLATLTRHRSRLAALEIERGADFNAGVASAGLLQPGRVRERNQDQPQDEPETVEAQTPQEEPAPEDGDAFQEALEFEAARVLAEADQAFQEGRYNEAFDKYSEIVGPLRDYATAEGLERAQDRMPEIRVLLGQAGGGLLETELERRQLVVEQARAEFENLIEQARAALAAGDTEAARQRASEARLRLTEAREFLAQDEFDARLEQQRELLRQIAQAEETIRQAEAAQRETELLAETAEREARLERERQEKIVESLERIRALQMEQKYEEALQVVDQLLFIDPLNPAGLLLRDVLQDTMIYREFNELQREKNLSYARESVQMQEGMIIPDSLMEYPADWPAIVQRRVQGAGVYTDPPEDRRVLAALQSTNIPASFTDNTLEDVLNFIATVTNLNMDVDWDSLAEVGVDRDTLVSLNLQPLPARTILDRVLDKVSPDEFNAASWAVNDGILVVASEAALRRNTFIQIYDIQDLLFQVPDFTEVPDLELGQIVQGQGGSEQDVEIEVPDSLTPEALLERIREIIQTNVDFDGWRDNGGDTGDIQELNGNLIVTNTAANHRAISNLLSQLREVRAIQINVEARFLSVSEDFFEQVGFDLDVVFNADNNQFQSALAQQQNFSFLQDGTGTTLPSDLVGPFFGGGANRTGASPGIVLDNPEEVFEGEPVSEFVTEFVPFTVVAPDNTSLVPVSQNSLGLAQQLFQGSPFANALVGADPALGLAATFLDDIQVDLLIEATQADRRSVTLSSPRLTFANGRWANIAVVTQTAFVSDLQPIVGTRSVAFDPEPGIVSTGFTLLVRGVVSADRRYVTLIILAETATNLEFDNFVVSAQTQGGGTGGGAVEEEQTFSGSLQQPTIDVTALQTSATVPDQGTVLLGGQRVSNDFEIETGVPVLSKLPIINRFFTNRVDAREESTLLILVKPTILIQNEQEELNFPGLMDTVGGGFGG
jgi:type II secretory pathway component GspD/PulD (secretin)